MLVEVPREQALAILGAMRAVALEHGGGAVTEMDRETIAGAAAIVFGLEGVEADEVDPIDPAGLAGLLDSEAEAEQAVQRRVDAELGPRRVATLRRLLADLQRALP